MRISHVDATPFHTFAQQIAAGQGQTASKMVALYRAKASLPDGVDAIVVASDLQGVAPLAAAGGARRLVGEALAEQLETLAAANLVPPLERVGVVLAGDLYSAPGADVRGASGDVRSVWRAFAARHRWVVGVAGNHDTFGDGAADAEAFAAEPRIFLLDHGAGVELDGLRIAGVGGIIGDARKPGRRDEREFLRAMRRALAEQPALLVMHHGPDARRGELRGHAEIRRALERSGELVVICGHVYWPEPLADLRGGAQVLNADSRVVVIERA
jgi:Icc-related predicted phosphoesterase